MKNRKVQNNAEKLKCNEEDAVSELSKAFHKIWISFSSAPKFKRTNDPRCQPCTHSLSSPSTVFVKKN
jgi:hypothetical protein